MPLQKTTPQEIIRKSIEVFREKGYYRASMADLAKANGLSKGVFYHHFANKEEVMKLALKASTAWFEKHIFSIAYAEDLPGKQRLQRMADTLYEILTENIRGCFYAKTILETSHVEDTFLKQINYFFVQFEDALQHIFKEKYTEEELNQVVQMSISDIEGSMIMMQLKKDPQLLKAALDRTINKL